MAKKHREKDNRIMVEYWLRTADFKTKGRGHRAIAVCVIFDPESKRTGRGIAILSARDQFDYKEGTRRARNRAWKGLYANRPLEQVHNLAALEVIAKVFANPHAEEAAKRALLSRHSFLYKAVPQPTLSKLEADILERRIAGN